MNRRRKWIAGLVCGALVLAAVSAWEMWRNHEMQQYRHFVLAGRHWFVPKPYGLFLDSRTNPTFFYTRFEYPEMTAGSTYDFSRGNGVSVTVRLRSQGERESVSQRPLSLMKEIDEPVYIGETNGFDQYRVAGKQPGAYAVYWFKKDESDYSMYVRYQENPRLHAYHVIRSLGGDLVLEYSAKKVHFDRFEKVDELVVGKVSAFIVSEKQGS